MINIEEFVSLKKTPKNYREIYFKTYSSANRFSKEFLKASYLTDEIEISQTFTDDRISTRLKKVIDSGVVVKLEYYANSEKDKDLLRKLLAKYQNNIDLARSHS